MTAEQTARARRSKRLGWASERRAAEIFGTKRYPANTGGPVDLLPVDGLYLQVKAGKTITMATLLDGLDAARRGAEPSHGLGAVVLEYHRAPRHSRTVICFDAAEYADWHGYARRDAGEEG